MFYVSVFLRPGHFQLKAMDRSRILHFFLLLPLLVSSNLLINEDSYYPIAHLSSSWINSPSTFLVHSHDESKLKPILLTKSSSVVYVCGFYCNYDCDGFLFAVLIFRIIEKYSFNSPKVVWSANRSNLVRYNATLQLTKKGNLILTDEDGTLVWSSNTLEKSVVGLNLTETGNLVLFDGNNASVWQSFDYPTDSLVPEQKLDFGQKLTASMSEINWSRGLLSFFVSSEGAIAYVESNPPQIYASFSLNVSGNNTEPYVRFKNGGLFLSSGKAILVFPPASSAQYMKLEPKGQLRVYKWDKGEWMILADIFSVSDCYYPLACGKYGICSRGQCSCPGSIGGESIYFKPTDYREPDLGCSAVTPLSCEASHHHSLLVLEETTYFSLKEHFAFMDIESCKQACLKNCSCKAAVVSFSGLCHLLSEMFSLTKSEWPFHSTTFIKVQNIPSEVAPSPVPPKKNLKKITLILVSCLGALLGLLLIFGIWLSIFWKRKNANDDEDDYLHQLPGMPTRFSHEILGVMTKNFSRKLGKGGFGSVYEGTLSNGTKVAVKRLDDFGPIKKSFLAEVQTIGNIHHINLVRLIGYCADKSYRLIVYEYMCNGSLDKWIFHRSQDPGLDWKTRRKIILDVAKGLAYLHEECQQKIVHLDIKPQNILLNENFDAKVSDFGLSKLIDRDQSQVVTTLRGTPGYMAPEWLSNVITEKADIYSFGIVVLEILCGRRNFDCFQPDEGKHLLGLFKKKAEEGQLVDMVDMSSEDMQLYGAKVVEMMRVAAWCLQSEATKRPSMSVVVKVLEGVMDVKENLDYNFFYQPVTRTAEAIGQREGFIIDSPILPSVLSGPR